MKTQSLFLLLAGMLGLGLLPLSRADEHEDKIQHFYDWMNTQSFCGNTFMMMPSDFVKAFPEDDRANALADLIDRAQHDGKSSAIYWSLRLIIDAPRGTHGIHPWNKRLETLVLSLSHKPDPAVRSQVAEVLISLSNDKWRSTILGFLEDSSDQVRETVLREITKAQWPDKLTIAQKYLDKNKNRSAFAQSVFYARIITNPEDCRRADEISKKLFDPECVNFCRSYIIKHKDDSDYAISVRTAQFNLDQLAAIADEKKKSDEDKKREDLDDKLNKDLDAGLPATAQTIQEKIDLFYYLFSRAQYDNTVGSDDPVRQLSGMKLFTRVVPFQERATVLAKLAAKALGEKPTNQAVMCAVINQAITQPHDAPEKRIWNLDLEKAICTQEKNPNMFVRLRLVQVLQGWHVESRHPDLLTMLDADPNEMVREYALGAIYDWPDGKKVLSDYANDHRDHPKDASIVFAINQLLSGK